MADVPEQVDLLAPDDCRICYHGPHPGEYCRVVEPCGGRHAPARCYAHGCGCDEYVDLAAESRIVVVVEEGIYQ